MLLLPLRCAVATVAVVISLTAAMTTTTAASDVAYNYPDLTQACTLPTQNVCATVQWGCGSPTSSNCNGNLQTGVEWAFWDERCNSTTPIGGCIAPTNSGALAGKLTAGCRHCFICPGSDSSLWTFSCPTPDTNPYDVLCPACVCSSNGIDARRCNNNNTLRDTYTNGTPPPAATSTAAAVTTITPSTAASTAPTPAPTGQQLYTSASATQGGVTYSSSLISTTTASTYNIALTPTAAGSITNAIVHFSVSSSSSNTQTQQNVYTTLKGNNWIYPVLLHPGDQLTYSHTFFNTAGAGYNTANTVLVLAAAAATTAAVPTTAPATKIVVTLPATTAAASTVRPTASIAAATVAAPPVATAASTAAPAITTAPTTTTAATPATTTPTPTATTSAATQGPFGSNLVWSDEFNTDFNFSTWRHLITASGCGNNEFEYYSNNRSNSYVDASTGLLYLQPTLTADAIGGAQLLTNGQYTLDLWASGCNDNSNNNGCTRTGSSQYPINPIQSARISTVNSYSYQYGRLEARVKLPAGDYLWPAIWLQPVANAYGNWPASGEIDVMESRGNNVSYSAGGVNTVSSALHFGPHAADSGAQYVSSTATIAATPATATAPASQRTFHDDFHVYGLYWDANQLYTYIDADIPANRLLSVSFTQPTASTATSRQALWNRYPYWQKFGFSNPWQHSSNSNAPFDQKFFITMNVAVGGTNGYFPMGSSSYTSAADFLSKQADWYATWNNTGSSTQTAMQVDWIRVYQ